MPPHRRSSSVRQTWGNQLFMDGLARWIKFDRLLFIHSWSAEGTREAQAERIVKEELKRGR